ncbi:MAG: hydantoinase/oxoprolinase family protein [Coprobacillaceae bacterium]
MLQGILILVIFFIFAGLMMTKKMQTILALPLMGIIIALVAGVPLISNNPEDYTIAANVLEAGSMRLSSAIAGLVFGAFFGQILNRVGIVKGIIKKAAELAGDKPLIIALVLYVAASVIFAGSNGLGMVILVGTIIIPIMLTAGISPFTSAIILLLANTTGGTMNVSGWAMYVDLFGLDISTISGTSLFIMIPMIIIYIVLIIYHIQGKKRTKKSWAMPTSNMTDQQKNVNPLALLSPIVPVALVFAFKLTIVPAVIIGMLVALLLTLPKKPLQVIAASFVEGLKDVAGAANLLGYVPIDDYAYSDSKANNLAWQALGEHCNLTAEEVARQVIAIACNKVIKVVDELIEDYQLDRNYITLVGGGGSASVLTYALGEKTGYRVQIAENAPFISTIGVALAMVREQIEKTVVNPTDEDIKKIRAEVIEKIVRSGANEETVDVVIEIDAQKNILSAIATGSTEMRSKDLTQKQLTEEEMTRVVSQAMNIDSHSLQLVVNVERWYLFNAPFEKKSMFGLFKKKINRICVLDREGVARVRKEGAEYCVFKKENKQEVFIPFMNEHTVYSDANDTIPKVFLFYKEKMLDLTGIQSLQQMLSIIDVELEYVDNEDEILAIAYQ